MVHNKTTNIEKHLHVEPCSKWLDPREQSRCPPIGTHRYALCPSPAGFLGMSSLKNGKTRGLCDRVMRD